MIGNIREKVGLDAEDGDSILGEGMFGSSTMDRNGSSKVMSRSHRPGVIAINLYLDNDRPCSTTDRLYYRRKTQDQTFTVLYL
jgi:hypothetical protein